MDSINSAIADTAYFFLSPFKAVPLLGLTVISVILGVVLLWIYGKISAQDKIRAVKRKIYERLLEAVLFRHSVIVSLKSQGEMLLLSVRYLLLAVPPLLVLALPVVLVLSHLNFWYGYAPLKPGGEAVVKLSLTDPQKLYEVMLKDGFGVEISPPVRVESENAVYWRLNNLPDNDIVLTVKDSQGIKGEIDLKIESLNAPIYSSGYRSGIYSFFYPFIAYMPSFVDSYSISYLEAQYKILGVAFHWIVLFFILSLASGLLASRALKVEI